LLGSQCTIIKVRVRRVAPRRVVRRAGVMLAKPGWGVPVKVKPVGKGQRMSNVAARAQLQVGTGAACCTKEPNKVICLGCYGVYKVSQGKGNQPVRLEAKNP